MRPPICICNGVIRSGSTWSFNVCRELYQQTAMQLRTKFNSAYVDSESLEKFVAQPWAAASALTVLKAHDIGPGALKAIRAGNAKAVCTFRDPRDCVLSDWAFSKCAFEICVKRISSTLEPIRIYQSSGNVLLVKYEDMMIDRCREIHRIARHLGVAIDESMAKWIDSKTSFESCEKVCNSLKDKPAAQVLQIADHRVDRATHLHDNHLNGGIVGRWKQVFSADQIAFVNEYFAPWLVSLGYETTQSLEAFFKDAAISTSIGYCAPAQYPTSQLSIAGNSPIAAGAAVHH